MHHGNKNNELCLSPNDLRFATEEGVGEEAEKRREEKRRIGPATNTQQPATSTQHQ